jgi:membrane protease YdiL (CAAX protease family)
VITARAAGIHRAPALVAAVGLAAATRSLVGGSATAGSAPAALLFSAVLVSAVLWAGAKPTRISVSGVAVGAGAAAVLLGLSLVGLPAVIFGPRAATSTLLWWAPVVAVVAAAEELVLRGVLFDALRSRSGEVVAVAVTAVLFAVIHLPLYGVTALPIDLCVGVFLGSLRVASGGVTAPLVAHVLADLATGWVG